MQEIVWLVLLFYVIIFYLSVSKDIHTQLDRILHNNFKIEFDSVI